MKARIAVLAGDGIGPEVTAEAVRCLERIARLFGHDFELTQAAFGGIAIDPHGDPLPQATLEVCLGSRCRAARRGRRTQMVGARTRRRAPRQGLLRLRRELGVYANLRPVSVHPALFDASSLKPEVLEGVDLDFRARTHRRHLFRRQGHAAPIGRPIVCTYTVAEIERIVRVAARFARARRGKLALDRQIQCARNLAPVARGVRAHRRE